MGCSTLLTFTKISFPWADTTGTCFSEAPSLAPGTSSVMVWPQHITGTPEF